MILRTGNVAVFRPFIEELPLTEIPAKVGIVPKSVKNASLHYDFCLVQGTKICLVGLCPLYCH